MRPSTAADDFALYGKGNTSFISTLAIDSQLAPSTS